MCGYLLIIEEEVRNSSLDIHSDIITRLPYFLFCLGATHTAVSTEL